VVDNLGAPERIAKEAEWPGAPIVKAKVQIADVGYVNGQFGASTVPEVLQLANV